MRIIAADSGATVMQFAELRRELCHPRDSTNAATDNRFVKFTKVAAKGILVELHYEKKQLGNICPYRDLLYPFKDAQRRSRRDYMVMRPQMIGAKVP